MRGGVIAGILAFDRIAGHARSSNRQTRRRANGSRCQRPRCVPPGRPGNGSPKRARHVKVFNRAQRTQKRLGVRYLPTVAAGRRIHKRGALCYKSSLADSF
jgi:hypothetical protein